MEADHSVSIPGDRRRDVMASGWSIGSWILESRGRYGRLVGLELGAFEMSDTPHDVEVVGNLV